MDFSNSMDESMLESLVDQLKSQSANSSLTTENVTLPSSMSDDTELTFDELFAALQKYAYFETEYCDHPLIGEGLAKKAQDRFGNVFIQCSIHYFAPFKNGKYTPCEHVVNVPMYDGRDKIKNLPVKPVLDSELRMGMLIERGLKFMSMTEKPTYLLAVGYFYVPTQSGMKRIPVSSRVVVDAGGYQRFAADRWFNKDQLDKVPDSRLANTLPTVPAYSMELKRWGEVAVDDMCEITFDKTAIERTVLPESYKKTIVTLTQNFYKSESVDFIAGKKKGLLFLLKGPPGTGKTLTANAVAELLEAPLYSVGAGDLGTKPDDIDRNLQHIFNLVENWKGCVLIDEADVFMSQRTDYAVDYNSCVSVFLRLIENYSGILFLTTNRDHNIDPAFDSRIHIRLHYGELNASGREQVWRESLQRHGIDKVDVSKIKEYKLNNREITNLVQLANTEVEGKKNLITEDLLERYIRMRLYPEEFAPAEFES